MTVSYTLPGMLLTFSSGMFGIGLGAIELLMFCLILLFPLLVVGAIVWLAVKAPRGRRTPTTQQLTEEARMIQDMYHGFEKMEGRIEALETILLEKGMKE